MARGKDKGLDSLYLVEDHIDDFPVGIKDTCSLVITDHELHNEEVPEPLVRGKCRKLRLDSETADEIDLEGINSLEVNVDQENNSKEVTSPVTSTELPRFDFEMEPEPGTPIGLRMRRFFSGTCHFNVNDMVQRHRKMTFALIIVISVVTCVAVVLIILLP